VVEERVEIRGLDDLGGRRERARHVAVGAHGRAARLGEGLGLGGVGGGRVIGPCALVPGDLQLTLGGEGGPRGRGENGDAGQKAVDVVRALDHERVLHARERLDAVEVGAHDLAAVDGTFRVGGVEHARQLLVDAEKGLAGDDGGVVDAADAGAEDLELRLALQLHVALVRDRERGGLGGELAIGEGATGRGVDHATLVGRELLGAHAPGLGRRLDEHRAGGGAGAAQEHVIVGRGTAAAGELGPDVAAQAGLLDDDGGEIGVELLGDDHGQGGFHALAGLGVLGEDGDDVLRCYFDERSGGEHLGRVVERLGDLGEGVAREGEAQGKAAAGEGGDADEVATGDGGGFHFAPSLASAVAASFTAARMRA